jgi:hypothetical protein
MKSMRYPITDADLSLVTRFGEVSSFATACEIGDGPVVTGSGGALRRLHYLGLSCIIVPGSELAQ